MVERDLMKTGAWGDRMIYVVRHGETEWNAINKVLGRTDIPLNANGVKFPYRN